MTTSIYSSLEKMIKSDESGMSNLKELEAEKIKLKFQNKQLKELNTKLQLSFNSLIKKKEHLVQTKLDESTKIMKEMTEKRDDFETKKIENKICCYILKELYIYWAAVLVESIFEFLLNF